ncbi:MAG: lipoprotein Spr [Flavobacteriales bacterium]|jgi:lipoprotein Spr
MYSKLYISFTIVLLTLIPNVSWAINDSTVVDGIAVEKTDEFCEAGLDLDSCSYLPLYNAAYDWLGTPYKYGGTSKKGVDCSAFTKAVLEDSYDIVLHGNSKTLHVNSEKITDQRNLKEGDLVFFKINKSHVSHIGVYLQNGYFVHASCSKGVMVNNLNESYYKKYYFEGGSLNSLIR